MITMKHTWLILKLKLCVTELNLMTRSHFIEILTILTKYLFDLGVRLTEFFVTAESVTLRFYCIYHNIDETYVWGSLRSPDYRLTIFSFNVANICFTTQQILHDSGFNKLSAIFCDPFLVFYYQWSQC